MAESRVEKAKRAKKKGGGTSSGGGKSRFWKTKKFKWIMAILAFLIVAVVGVYAYFIGHFLNAIQNPKSDQPKVVNADVWSGTDPVNIVLFGVDNRNNDPHPRSDSILIIHIDPVTKKAKVMSVMRDTWYNIPDNGYEKINAAMAIGGPDLAIKTLKDFLKIPINYYVKTDFQGFEKIVDAIGGVTIDVEKPLHYADDGVYDINLDAGVQHLDGAHALMYVRFRHDAMSDFARTDRQRKFLAAVADQMETPATVLKLPTILQDVEPYIETNMTLDDMIKLGKLALTVDKNDLQSLQVPPMEDLKEGIAGGGQSVLIPNVYETQKAVYSFLGLDPSTLVEDTNKQPPQYYQPDPVVPTNPNVKPDTPEPPVKKPVTPTPSTGGTGGKTPPSTGGGTTPPTNGGGTTPPTNGGGTKPPTNGGGTTPPTNGGGTTPPTNGGGTTPPTNGGGTTPPTNGGGTTPPTNGGGTTPPTNGGGTTPPTNGGGSNPPATPVTGGGSTTTGQ
ncbi:MAG: LCP family glycopolymer transferase [Tumebacillaceae bacterium]